MLRLREVGGPCTDTSPHLASLCQLLENILRKGLQREWVLRAQAGGGSVPVPVTKSLVLLSSCRASLGLQEKGLLALAGAASHGGHWQVSGIQLGWG